MPIRSPKQIHLGTTGPPNSALPNNPRYLLAMRRVMPRMAVMVYRVTLKLRSPALTLNLLP